VRDRGEAIGGIGNANLLELRECDFVFCDDQCHFVGWFVVVAPSAATGREYHRQAQGQHFLLFFVDFFSEHFS
jgi:hypothetical protein